MEREKITRKNQKNVARSSFLRLVFPRPALFHGSISSFPPWNLSLQPPLHIKLRCDANRSRVNLNDYYTPLINLNYHNVTGYRNRLIEIHERTTYASLVTKIYIYIWLGARRFALERLKYTVSKIQTDTKGKRWYQYHGSSFKAYAPQPALI